MTANGNTGRGRRITTDGTSDTGYFWFFNDKNVELAVKIVDGTGVNGKYWVFYGSLTTAQFDLKVTDTQTGNVKIYRNPSGSVLRTRGYDCLLGRGTSTQPPPSLNRLRLRS